MKSLFTYLIEGLKSDVQQWLKNVYQTQQSLVKDNKVQPIQVDVNKLNKPKKAFEFEDFSTDAIAKKIVGDRQVGFVVTNQMIRNPKQYIQDENKELKPECLPYWYQEGENIYFVGICIYDKQVSYIDNFVHIIGIESSLIVAESAPLLKAILNDFIKFIGKEGNFTGISAKPTHPKMKANLIKLGFNSFKDNKEILTYKL
jgi:hypothetical protein